MMLGMTKTKQDITNAILDLASKKKQVVYGARSTNAQLPNYLKKETKDYDILTKNAEGSANELKDKLNKEYEEGFTVEPAKHKGTFKVKDKNGNAIADYTNTTKYPKSKLVLGIKYANLDYSKKKLKKILKDEASSFRWDKDRETLNRLREGKKW